jgi:DNA-binding transcriptional LysR family regulator
VAEAEAAEQAVTRMQAAPHGLLRVTAPLTFSLLGPLVAGFMKRYPEVQLEMVCTDRTVDLVEEGFDLAIRAGRLTDSSLMARRLGSVERLVVAAPSYVKTRGAPKTPKELEKHDCLLFGPGREGNVWSLNTGSKSVEVPVRARLSVNEPDMLRALTLAGAGIALLPNILCTTDLAEGRLQRILPDWGSPGAPVHAVYPSTRHHSPKVMAFVDFLRERWPPQPSA